MWIWFWWNARDFHGWIHRQITMHLILSWSIRNENICHSSGRCVNRCHFLEILTARRCCKSVLVKAYTVWYIIHARFSNNPFLKYIWGANVLLCKKSMNYLLFLVSIMISWFFHLGLLHVSKYFFIYVYISLKLYSIYFICWKFKFE